MDPNLFAIDWERALEVLGAIVLMSFFVERALALLFENRWFVDRFTGRGIKEPVTFAVAFAVCRNWDFDALSVILVREKTQLWGHLVTAGIVAGGSKASLKFFHDVVGAMSTAERERQAFSKLKTGTHDPHAGGPPPSGQPPAQAPTAQSTVALVAKPPEAHEPPTQPTPSAEGRG